MFVFSIIVSLIAIFYTFFKYRYAHWKRLDIPYLTPTIPFGNFENIPVGVQVRGYYQKFKARGEKYGGVYIMLTPTLVLTDPDIIKNILTKDANHFVEKPFYYNEKDQPLSAILFFIGGEKWRILRQKLTPTFTSGKMKMMLASVLECTLPMAPHLEEAISNKYEIDIKEVAANFTTDVIGSVAFGISCNSFKDPDAEFRFYGKEIFKATPFLAAKGAFQFAFQNFSRKLGLLPFPPHVDAFFSKAVKDTIEYRENNNIVKNDFMQLLINMKNSGEVDAKIVDTNNKITLNEIIAQCFVFYIAGFETSSTTLTFCLLELAKNQEIQNRVRKEIWMVLAKHNGKITYEALNEMTYMKQVIDETLRFYPPVPTLDRSCTSDYKFPDSDIVMPAGTPVLISTLGMHRDPELFENPDVFDPERFAPENISKIKPYTYLPFGEGPRMCLGLRFAFMQVKVGLVTLLKNFRYTLSEKTSPDVEFDLGFTLAAKGVILLNISKVED